MFRSWFSASARERQLFHQLAEEQAAHEATRRKLRIAEAEIESLAAVLARDRARVLAETASYARQRAEAEGNKK
jgi:hypothetical protein